MISLLNKQFATPDHFYRLQQSIASQIKFRLEPELENESVSYWLERLENNYQTAQTLWRDSKKEINEILGDSSLLSGKKYRDSWMANRLAAVDLVFESGEIAEDKVKWFFQSVVNK